MADVTTAAGSDTSSLGDLTPVPIVREDLLSSTGSISTVTVGQDVNLPFISGSALIVGSDALFVAPEKPSYVPATLDDTLSVASVADLPAPTLAAEGVVLLDESMLLESALLQPSANNVPSSNVQPSSNDYLSTLENAMAAGEYLTPTEIAALNDPTAFGLNKTSASVSVDAAINDVMARNAASLEVIIGNMR